MSIIAVCPQVRVDCIYIVANQTHFPYIKWEYSYAIVESSCERIMGCSVTKLYHIHKKSYLGHSFFDMHTPPIDEVSQNSPPMAKKSRF
jgi:hypothetical protein